MMDEQTCAWAYRLARSFVEWKDMAGAVHDPMETQDAWRRLTIAEELFRRQLDGPEGRPCEGCPDPENHDGPDHHVLHDVRSFDEDT